MDNNYLITIDTIQQTEEGNDSFSLSTLGVYAEEISHDLNQSGGTVDLRYSLDLNANFFALNHLKITVKKKKNPKDV